MNVYKERFFSYCFRLVFQQVEIERLQQITSHRIRTGVAVPNNDVNMAGAAGSSFILLKSR